MDSPTLCCDAFHYMGLGQRCAAEVVQCWDRLRPIGAALYFSVPFRLGLPPRDFGFVFNLLLAVAAAVLAARAVTSLLSHSTRASRAGILGVSLISHVLLTWRASDSFVSDVPAAVAMTSSIWLLILGHGRNQDRYFAAAGAALGMAAWLRSYYLYPAVATAICYAVVTLARRQRPARAILFCLLLAFPVTVQLSATRVHTGTWSFIDSRVTANQQRLHFENATFGYDTLVRPSVRGFRHDAPQCFERATGFGDAARKGHWGELACLLAYRQWFYLGSYTPGGEIYLVDPEQRRFSRAFFALNLLAVLAAALWAFGTRDRALLLAPAVVLLGAVWGEGSIIIPESRFLMGFHMTTWVFAAAALHQGLARWGMLSLTRTGAASMATKPEPSAEPAAAASNENPERAPVEQAPATAPVSSELPRGDGAPTVVEPHAQGPAVPAGAPRSDAFLYAFAILAGSIVIALLARAYVFEPEPAAGSGHPTPGGVQLKDPAAADKWREAFRKDPEAMEKLKKALREDPKAQEALRKELARQQGKE
jgi:hypothetical protein